MGAGGLLSTFPALASVPLLNTSLRNFREVKGRCWGRLVPSQGRNALFVFIFLSGLLVNLAVNVTNWEQRPCDLHAVCSAGIVGLTSQAGGVAEHSRRPGDGVCRSEVRAFMPFFF